MQTVRLAVTMNQLDFDKVPEIVGGEALKLFEKLYHIMQYMARHDELAA